MDYESLPYQKDVPENQHSENILSAQVPRRDLMFPQNKESFQIENQHLISFKSQPNFHSTKIEQTITEITDDLFKVVTSTKIQEKFITKNLSVVYSVDKMSGKSNLIQKAYENHIYSSPKVNIPNQDEMQNHFTSYYSIKDFNLVNTTHFESDNIFVCCLSYHGKFKGDLVLEFSEKVILKHEIDNFFLVQKISTGQTGYVPRYHITSLIDFESNC